MASLKKSGYYKNKSADQLARDILRNVETSSAIETGRPVTLTRQADNPVFNTELKYTGPEKKIMPAYDFNKPADVAAYLMTLSKGGSKDWAGWFDHEKPPEFMAEVRRISREILAVRKAMAKAAKEAKQQSAES